MEGQFQYHFDEKQQGPGIESSSFHAYTVDRGINSSRNVTFLVDGYGESFIDLSQCFLKTVFRVVQENGAELEVGTEDDPSTVFPTEAYGNNLWSQVSITLNNSPIPPGNDYQYTSKVIHMMGASQEHLRRVRGPLSGESAAIYGGSQVAMAYRNTHKQSKLDVAESKAVSVYSRIYSDFLTSCSQLLPNRMSLGLTLTRSPDNFVLCRSESETVAFKLEIFSATLFVKRVRPNPEALGVAEKMLGSGGKLLYQRLHTIALPCAQGTRSWSWHNVFQNVAPRKVFLALVSQEAYHGSWTRSSTYFESANVKTVNFKKDGRDILPQPYSVSFVYDEAKRLVDEASDAKSAFAGYCRMLGSFTSGRVNVGESYEGFMDGKTLYVAELEHAHSMAPAEGAVDVFVDFAVPCKEPLMVLVFGEYPKTIAFDSNRNITRM